MGTKSKAKGKAAPDAATKRAHARKADEESARVSKAAKRGDKKAAFDAAEFGSANLAYDGPMGIFTDREMPLDNPESGAVKSTQSPGNVPASATTNVTGDSDIMETLKLTRSAAPRKTNRLVIYNIEGRTGSVQFLSTLFGGSKDSVGNPPAELELMGEFAPARVNKPKETAEERKARLAALPKLTPAERLAKMEEKVAKAKAKLAAGGTQ